MDVNQGIHSDFPLIHSEYVVLAKRLRQLYPGVIRKSKSLKYLNKYLVYIKFPKQDGAGKHSLNSIKISLVRRHTVDHLKFCVDSTQHAVGLLGSLMKIETTEVVSTIGYNVEMIRELDKCEVPNIQTVWKSCQHKQRYIIGSPNTCTREKCYCSLGYNYISSKLDEESDGSVDIR